MAKVRVMCMCVRVFVCCTLQKLASRKRCAICKVQWKRNKEILNFLYFYFGIFSWTICEYIALIWSFWCITHAFKAFRIPIESILTQYRILVIVLLNSKRKKKKNENIIEVSILFIQCKHVSASSKNILFHRLMNFSKFIYIFLFLFSFSLVCFFFFYSIHQSRLFYFSLKFTDVKVHSNSEDDEMSKCLCLPFSFYLFFERNFSSFLFLTLLKLFREKYSFGSKNRLKFVSECEWDQLLQAH